MSVQAIESALREFEQNNHPDDVEAYRANHEVFKGGLSKEQIAEYYNNWAESGQYDAVGILITFS